MLSTFDRIKERIYAGTAEPRAEELGCPRLLPAGSRLGSLAFPCHACNITIGIKLDPISALLESRLPVCTELRTMAREGRWRIYVWLG
jgi:hypothetical protein